MMQTIIYQSILALLKANMLSCEKPLLSEEDIEFQIDTYKWLLKNFGGKHFYDDATLVLPTIKFFPKTSQQSKDAPLSIFNLVKEYCGLQDWDCKLVAQDADINPIIAPTVILENIPQKPAGTFSVQQEQVLITYNPNLTTNLESLIATFAHELSHYLTGTTADDPPGGWENWEFATDIASTFLGFGTFMANSAFNYQQVQDVDSIGWSTQGAGYLSEMEHLYALAIFLSLKEIDVEVALPFLKKYLRSSLRKAYLDVKKREIVALLKKQEYSPTYYADSE